MKENWFNDNEYKCKTCEVIFKSYALGDTNDVNFCPYCGSRDLDYFEEDES